MAPWAQRSIAAQLEKVRSHNQEQIAKKVVALIDTRAQVQRMAILVARRAARWYDTSFHLTFDEERRNLCDNFIKSLVQQFAARQKPIRGVPLPGIGLAGAALLKADLLSVWISDKGKTGIGPIAVALYNAGYLSLRDIQAVISACLDKVYLTSHGGRHRDDALLLLEVSARDLDGQVPRKLDEYMLEVSKDMDSNPKGVDEHKMSGKREIPSLRDRYNFLEERRQCGWRKSPYGTENASPVAKDLSVNDIKVGQRTSSLAAVKTANNSSDSGEVVEHHSDADDDDVDEVESSQPHTPSTLSAGSQTEEHGVAYKEQGSNPHILTVAQGTRIKSHDYAGAHDVLDDAQEKHPYAKGDDADADLRRAVSPWTAYFASAVDNKGGINEYDAEQGVDSRKHAAAPRENIQVTDGGDDAAADDDTSIHSAADLAVQRRESAASYASNVKRRPLPLPPMMSAIDSSKTGRARTGRPDAQAEHVSFGQALQGGYEKAPPAGASRAPSIRRGGGATRRSASMERPTLPASVSAEQALARSMQKPIVFDDEDAIWLNLDASLHGAKDASPVRVRFPSQFRLGDARRLARLFTAAIRDDEQDTTHHRQTSTGGSIIHYASAPIYFLPDGLIGQTLPFAVDGSKAGAAADETVDIFVQYASTMTLAEARSAAQRLADALATYTQAQQA